MKSVGKYKGTYSANKEIEQRFYNTSKETDEWLKEKRKTVRHLTASVSSAGLWKR